MATCTITDICGTGGWTGPKPGDPNTDSISLTAVPTFGGIKVSWTYPTVNPSAVSYTKVFRSVSNDFNTAFQVAVAAGNSHYDQIAEAGTYYYWIQVVSVNGTESDTIGPASATIVNRSEDIANSLADDIDAGHLSQSLRQQIDKITLNADGIRQEILDRISSNNAFAQALAATNGELTTALTLINTEITERVDGQNALVARQDILAAVNADNAAAIISEQEARLTADSALASDITALYAATNDNAAAVVTEAQARTDQDTALANQITTTQTTLDGQISSVRTYAESNINSLNGKVTDIGALYTVQVDVNGLAGGFGIYNNGTTVDAGFLADRFWIGSPSVTGVYPFVVDGGKVYMDKAVIKEASIDTLRIAGNAVTIPQGVTSNYLLYGSGNYNWLTYFTHSLYMDFTGQVIILGFCRMGTGGMGWEQMGSRMLVNGSTVGEGGIDSGYYFDGFSHIINVTAGSTITAALQFYGESSAMRMHGGTIIMLGLKR